MIRYPDHVSLAFCPTPLEFSKSLTTLFGGPDIWIKRDDMTGSVTGGNKLRKLEFSLQEALNQNAEVVITAGGIQSNHCRATALSCAKLGIKCHLILRGSFEGVPNGNLFLDYLAGATITFVQTEEFNENLTEICDGIIKQYAAEGKNAYWIPIGASNAVGSWGYARAYEELLIQAEEKNVEFDAIFSATGSGGTMAGLIAGRALHKNRFSVHPNIHGVNVCDDEAYFVNEITNILKDMKSKYDLDFNVEEQEISILDGYVGEGYAKSYSEEVSLIKEICRVEGLLFDTVYTGKALYGMKQEIAKGRYKTGQKIVFIHTGGFFGNFAVRSEFDLPAGTNG